MRVHKTSWIRRLGTIVGIAPLLVASLGAPVSADPLADRRAEAARIEAEVEAQSAKLSALTERVNQARLRAREVTAQVEATEAAAARVDAQVAEAKQTLRRHAVQTYVRGGRVADLQFFLTGNERDFAIRNSYFKALTRQQRSAIDALADARERQEAKRAELAAAEKQAKDALAKVDADQRAAAAADAQVRATLSRINGELAALVEAESRRRAEETARRAQAELAARQARDQAARQARPSAPAPGPVPAPNRGAAAAVEEAKRQIGKPYEWGAEGPDSFDCSGLTLWAWRAGGVSLPHSAEAQYRVTRRVALGDIQPGDLLFFGTPIHHVGIYVGNGTMVEASQTGTPVRYRSIHRSDMVGVGRPGA